MFLRPRLAFGCIAHAHCTEFCRFHVKIRQIYKSIQSTFRVKLSSFGSSKGEHLNLSDNITQPATCLKLRMRTTLRTIRDKLIVDGPFPNSLYGKKHSATWLRLEHLTSQPSTTTRYCLKCSDSCASRLHKDVWFKTLDMGKPCQWPQ